MNRTFLFAIVAIALLVPGCDSGSADQGEERVLGLKWIEAFRKSEDLHAGFVRSSPSVEGETSIDLGQLGGSRDYYFAVTNSGHRSIRNVSVTLQTEDPAYSIEPDTIPEILTAADADTWPFVRLHVDHGYGESGLFITPLLSPGDHTVSLELLGTLDVSPNAATSTSLRAQLSFEALVTDIILTDSSGIRDLAEPNGRSLGGPVNGIEWTPVFRRFGKAVVRNSGNTVVEVDFLNSYNDILLDKILQVDDTLEVPERLDGWVRIGRGTAVRDLVRLPLEADGRTYLGLHHYEDL